MGSFRSSYKKSHGGFDFRHRQTKPPPVFTNRVLSKEYAARASITSHHAEPCVARRSTRQIVPKPRADEANFTSTTNAKNLPITIYYANRHSTKVPSTTHYTIAHFRAGARERGRASRGVRANVGLLRCASAEGELHLSACQQETAFRSETPVTCDSRGGNNRSLS